MTLRGAIAPTGSYSQYKGGAITSNRDVTAATMVFLENTGGVGGAIGARGSIDVFGATFQGNRAAFGGGALFTDTGSVTVVDASFTGNRVPGIYTGTAGAIALYADRPLRILRATFEDNGARQAGAVYAGGTVELSSATFARNQAVEFAGALYANREVAITDGTFVENRVGIGAKIGRAHV